MTLGLALAIGILAAAAPPGPDDDDSDSTGTETAPLKTPHKTKVTTAEEEMVEKKEPEKLSSLDDPHLGLSFEAVFDLALLAKTYGSGPVPAPGFGLRFDWAVGRLWTDPADEFWKYALLVEAAYDYTSLSDGTQEISTGTAYHYVSLRGVFGYPVKDIALFYAALGGGFTVEHTSYDVVGTGTSLTGVRPDFDYGLGARVKLALNPSLALCGRAELMRFRRAYLDDTFVTVGAGVDF